MTFESFMWPMLWRRRAAIGGQARAAGAALLLAGKMAMPTVRYVPDCRTPQVYPPQRIEVNEDPPRARRKQVESSPQDRLLQQRGEVLKVHNLVDVIRDRA